MVTTEVMIGLIIATIATAITNPVISIAHSLSTMTIKRSVGFLGKPIVTAESGILTIAITADLYLSTLMTPTEGVEKPVVQCVTTLMGKAMSFREVAIGYAEYDFAW